MAVHCDIPVISCLVKTEYLYDLDSQYKGQYSPCQIYAISSYKDHVPTFKIKLANGSLFDYIPPDAFVTKTIIQNELSLEDLVFGKNCQDYDISVNEHRELKRFPNVRCFFKKKDLWISGLYVCTVDWYTQNQNCHIILLENGQIGLVPNHKLIFSDKPVTSLEPYKKLHAEFKI